MEEISAELINVANISTYLGKEHELQEVIEKMIGKLKEKNKSVKEFNTP